MPFIKNPLTTIIKKVDPGTSDEDIFETSNRVSSLAVGDKCRFDCDYGNEVGTEITQTTSGALLIKLDDDNALFLSFSTSGGLYATSINGADGGFVQGSTTLAWSYSGSYEYKMSAVAISSSEVIYTLFSAQTSKILVGKLTVLDGAITVSTPTTVSGLSNSSYSLVKMVLMPDGRVWTSAGKYLVEIAPSSLSVSSATTHSNTQKSVVAVSGYIATVVVPATNIPPYCLISQPGSNFGEITLSSRTSILGNSSSAEGAGFLNYGHYVCLQQISDDSFMVLGELTPSSGGSGNITGIILVTVTAGGVITSTAPVYIPLTSIGQAPDSNSNNRAFQPESAITHLNNNVYLIMGSTYSGVRNRYALISVNGKGIKVLTTTTGGSTLIGRSAYAMIGGRVIAASGDASTRFVFYDGTAKVVKASAGSSAYWLPFSLTYIGDNKFKIL